MKPGGVVLPLAAFVTLASGWARGVQISCPEILKRVGEMYRELRSYELVAEKSVALSAGGLSSYSQTQISFAAVTPGKVRLALKSPARNILLVSNGEATWTYLPNRKEFTQEAVAASVGEEELGMDDEEQTDALTEAYKLLVGRYLRISTLGPAARMVREERLKVAGNKEASYLVRAQVEGYEHELWIDAEGFVVLRHRQVSRFSRRGLPVALEVTVTLKEVELGKVLDNSLFEFVPPAKSRQVPALDLPGQRINLTGKVAADFTLKDTQGKKISLGDFRGQVVLIDFWATWCAPCQAELPHIEKLNKEYAEKGVVVLAICAQDSWTVKAFLKKSGYTIQALLDPSHEVRRRYGVRAIPTVVIINREGVVTVHFVGPRGEGELLAALERAGL